MNKRAKSGLFWTGILSCMGIFAFVAGLRGQSSSAFGMDSEILLFIGAILAVSAVPMFIRALHSYYFRREEYAIALERQAESPLGRAADQVLSQDIQIVALLRKLPIFYLVYLGMWLGILAVVALFKLNVLNIVLAIFTASSIFFLAFIIAGELFQSRYLPRKRNIILDVVMAYVLAIPFIIIYTLLILLLILLYKENEDVDSYFWEKFSLMGLIVALKYFIYVNLAMITLGERRYIPIREAWGYYKENKIRMFSIWVASGVSLGKYLILFLTIAFGGLALDFQPLYGLGVAGFGLTMVCFFLFQPVSEQLAFLAQYLGLKYGEVPAIANLLIEIRTVGWLDDDTRPWSRPAIITAIASVLYALFVFGVLIYPDMPFAIIAFVVPSVYSVPLNVLLALGWIIAPVVLLIANMFSCFGVIKSGKKGLSLVLAGISVSILLMGIGIGFIMHDQRRDSLESNISNQWQDTYYREGENSSGVLEFTSIDKLHSKFSLEVAGETKPWAVHVGDIEGIARDVGLNTAIGDLPEDSNPGECKIGFYHPDADKVIVQTTGCEDHGGAGVVFDGTYIKMK